MWFEEASDPGKRDNISPYVQIVDTENRLLQMALEVADFSARAKTDDLNLEAQMELGEQVPTCPVLPQKIVEVEAVIALQAPKAVEA